MGVVSMDRVIVLCIAVEISSGGARGWLEGAWSPPPPPRDFSSYSDVSDWPLPLLIVMFSSQCASFKYTAKLLHHTNVCLL